MTNEEALIKVKGYLTNILPSEDYDEVEDIMAALKQEPCEDCISREEAEAIFKNARKSLYELSRKERVKDFQTREMMLLNAEQFIHLLPSVTPSVEPCEDAISREAVIDIIDFEDKWLHDASGHNANTKIAFSGLRSKVKALSSVQPQRKRGKWKWELASNGWVNHICSECGFTKNTDVHIKINWEYCPNCGAEMAGDSDD